MTCVNCNSSEKRPPAQVDPRLPHAQQVRAHGDPVLGPTLGGGLSGSHIGSGVGRVGGGDTPANLWASSPDPVHYPQVVQVFHADWSTPRRIFERGIVMNPALDRELGGLR
jgi:hypothetical protein